MNRERLQHTPKKSEYHKIIFYIFGCVLSVFNNWAILPPQVNTLKTCIPLSWKKLKDGWPFRFIQNTKVKLKICQQHKQIYNKLRDWKGNK